MRASGRHIAGATLGFTLLLLLIGLGLYELLERAPVLLRGIQWGGVAFLLYMAWRRPPMTDDCNLRVPRAPRFCRVR